MRVCSPIPLSCDYCFTLEVAYSELMNVQAGLTPAAVYYLFVTDKFGNQWSDQFTVNGDGSFDIDLTNYPAGMFNPFNGWFDLFVSEDSAGEVLVPMTFVSEYNCLKLSTYCADDLLGIGYDAIGLTEIL